MLFLFSLKANLMWNCWLIFDVGQWYISHGHSVIIKLTAFSLNFENELVFSESNDFLSTYVFKTHTNKFMPLNVNELSSITIMITLTMTNDNNIVSKFNAKYFIFIFGRIVKTPYSVQPYFIYEQCCAWAWTVNNDMLVCTKMCALSNKLWGVLLLLMKITLL